MIISRKLLILIPLGLSTGNSFCQILCINCYNQNLPVSTNITNMILNGSLETHNCIPNIVHTSTNCPNSTSYSCDVADWVCTGGGPSTYCGIFNNSITTVPDGNYAFYFGNAFCNLCNPATGDTSCLTGLGCTATGIPAGYPYNGNVNDYGGTSGVSMSQSVSGLIAGDVYVLEFWCGGERGWAYDGIFALNVGFGDTLLRNPTTPFGAIGRRYIIQFAATAFTQTIKFTNWGHISNFNTELVIDDVRLYPISQLSSIVPACAMGISKNESEFAISIKQMENQLSIQAGYNKNTSFKIYNILGQEVLEKEFLIETKADLSSLQKGLYVCKVYDGINLIGTQKIFIE